MDYSTIPLVSLMKARLSYLSERQGALAQNVANADTPGYKARDVAEPDFKRLVEMAGRGSQKLQMAMTSQKHVAGAGAAGSSQFKIIERASTAELNPDGSNVSIEEEMAKIGSNQGEYQKALNLYGKMVSMFRTALGNGG